MDEAKHLNSVIGGLFDIFLSFFLCCKSYLTSLIKFWPTAAYFQMGYILDIKKYYEKILSYFSVFHPQFFDIVVSAVILTPHKSHKCFILGGGGLQKPLGVKRYFKGLNPTPDKQLPPNSCPSSCQMENCNLSLQRTHLHCFRELIVSALYNVQISNCCTVINDFCETITFHLCFNCNLVRLLS